MAAISAADAILEIVDVVVQGRVGLDVDVDVGVAVAG